MVHECRQKSVRSFNGADSCQPQLLHQSVLQRMMRPFHAALGLAGIGAQNLNVETRRAPRDTRETNPLGQRHNLSTCLVLFHATMGFRDLVQLEDLA